MTPRDFRFNWSDVFGKEPAGAFRKAQRLIEPGQAMRFLDKAQVDQAAKLLSSQAKAQSTIKKKAPRPCSSLNPGHIIMNLTGGTTMTEPKLEVPAELRQLAERTIDQAEQVFALLFDAARRSTAAGTTSTAELTKQVLAFSEESLKTSFEHARKVASTASLQDVATAQSELVKRQIAGAEHHIRELARATGSKDRT